MSDTSRGTTHPWSRWPLYRCHCRRRSSSSGWEWGWKACRTHTASGRWQPERAERGWWRFACAGSAPALRWSDCSPGRSAGRSRSREWSVPSGLYLPFRTGKKDKYELSTKCFSVSFYILYRLVCLFWFWLGRGTRFFQRHPSINITCIHTSWKYEMWKRLLCNKHLENQVAIC